MQVLESWLADEAQPTPQSRALLAQMYGQLKRYAEAEQHIRRAIGQAATFHEEWYQLLLFASVEQQKFSQAVTVLHQLLNQLPRKKTYWLQLSQVYMQTEQQRQAASTLALAHKLGLFEEQEVLYVVAILFTARLAVQSRGYPGQRIDNASGGRHRDASGITGDLLAARQRVSTGFGRP